jgi:hypothetical protein
MNKDQQRVAYWTLETNFSLRVLSGSEEISLDFSLRGTASTPAALPSDVDLFRLTDSGT